MLLLETLAKLRFKICWHNYKIELQSTGSNEDNLTAWEKQTKETDFAKVCNFYSSGTLHPVASISQIANSLELNQQNSDFPRFLQGLNPPLSLTRSSFCHATPPRSVSCIWAAKSFPLKHFFFPVWGFCFCGRVPTFTVYRGFTVTRVKCVDVGVA